MHKFFFIYFLIYFCLPCFGLSLSPSSRDIVYKFGGGSSLLGMVSASVPGWNYYIKVYITTVFCVIYTPTRIETFLSSSGSYNQCPA
jgi:hypothetical protein